MRTVEITIVDGNRRHTFEATADDCPAGHAQASMAELLEDAVRGAKALLSTYIEDIQPCTHPGARG